MALVQCPTCGKKFESGDSPAMPFCCVRCRRADLNRWLNEEISVPYRELPEEPADRWHDEDED
jgi:endogenous inhibitor of DNA gyrase (YacG/DUF329 family)